MALNCDLAALIEASGTLVNPSISQQERQAIEIYVMAQNLLASGGSDLTDINDLLEAAKEWQSLKGTQAEGVHTLITVQNAIDNGASLTVDVEALSDSARCFLCLPQDTKLQLLEFLRCAVSSTGKPA